MRLSLKSQPLLSGQDLGGRLIFFLAKLIVVKVVGCALIDIVDTLLPQPAGNLSSLRGVVCVCVLYLWPDR